MWKLSKYEVISGLYFLVFGLNTGQYGPEISPYLDTFPAVQPTDISYQLVKKIQQMQAYNFQMFEKYALTSSQEQETNCLKI